FDITVQPILDLFAKSYERGKEPSEADIQSILPSIGADKLQVRGRSLYLSAEGMALSFDGVVPGYIADRAARILEGYGIKRYLVDAGGELRASGNGPSGGAWRVAVQDPKKEQNYPAVISLDRGAVSTSGSYESFYSDNGDFHHIVNAKTGRSPAQTTSVTVLAPTAIEADILSTALFVMPITEGLAYINARPQYSCLIIEKDGALFKSDNFAFS
ncbi:MAG: FAD:protein FMN transferase, partial [Bradymonadales bacterium]